MHMPMTPKSLLLVAALVVVISAVLLYLFPGIASSISNSVIGSVQGSGALESELQSPVNQTPGAVAEIVTQKIQQSRQFEVQYSGQAEVRYSGYGLAIPINVLFEKLGNNTRTSFNLTRIPLFGNITSVGITLANGTSYSCSSSNFFPYHQTSNENFSNSSVVCISSGRRSIGVAESLQNITSQLQSNQSTLKVKVIGIRQYNGQDCVLAYISGRASYNNTDSYNTVWYITYNGTSCLSSQYNVPLNLTMHVVYSIYTAEQNSSYDVQLNLSENSINGPVSIAQISALPGPATNPQSLGLSVGSTTTIPPRTYYFGSGSLLAYPVNSEFTVESIGTYNGNNIPLYNNYTNAAVNGTYVSFRLTQKTGTDWREIDVVYVPNGVQLNASGAPEVPFTYRNSGTIESGAAYDFMNGSTVTVDDVPISTDVTGTFHGSIWVKYFTINYTRVGNYTESISSGWKYAKVANVTITSFIPKARR